MNDITLLMEKLVRVINSLFTKLNTEVATDIKICWPLPSNQSFMIGKLSATGGVCMGDCRIVK